MLDKLKSYLPEWCRVEDPPSFLDWKTVEGLEDLQRFLVVARKENVQTTFIITIDPEDEDLENPEIDVVWQNNNQRVIGAAITMKQLTGFMEHVFDMLPFQMEKAFKEAENWVDDNIPVDLPKKPEPEEKKDDTGSATETPKEEPKQPKAVCVDNLEQEHGKVPNPQPAHKPVSVDNIEPPKDEPPAEPPKEAPPAEPPPKPLEPPTPPTPMAPPEPPPVKPLIPPMPPQAPPPPPPPVKPLMPPTPPAYTPQQPSPFVHPQQPPTPQPPPWAFPLMQQAPQPAPRPAPPRPSSPPPMTKERMSFIVSKMKEIVKANFPNLGRYRWANEDKGDTIEYTPTPPPNGQVPPMVVGIRLIYNTLNGAWTAALWRDGMEYSSDGPSLDIIKEDFISLH